MKQFATITVIGRDKTGVVARVTSYLFEQKANIEALEEQVTRGQFSMAIQASWKPRQLNAGTVRAGFDRLAKALGMEIKLRFTEPHRRQRMAVMASLEPRCLEALLASVHSGRLKAESALVLSNHRELRAVARACEVPFLVVPWANRVQAENDALRLLDEHEIDFIVLARFMKILSPNFVWRYKNKIINIHPSLLPSFPGPQAYRQAYEQGVKIIGVTAHFVTMRLDEGPIIAQGSFNARPGWTLKDIVAAGRKLETQVLLKAVQLYLAKRLDVYWGIVKQV